MQREGLLDAPSITGAAYLLARGLECGLGDGVWGTCWKLQIKLQFFIQGIQEDNAPFPALF